MTMKYLVARITRIERKYGLPPIGIERDGRLVALRGGQIRLTPLMSMAALDRYLDGLCDGLDCASNFTHVDADSIELHAWARYYKAYKPT